MQPLDMLMRTMTHLNIGAAIAMLAWVFWSGQQILSGEAPPARTPQAVNMATASAATAPAAPTAQVRP